MSTWGNSLGNSVGNSWGAIGAFAPSGINIEVYDNLNGSLHLQWAAIIGASSYNVYVNDVFNQSVSVPNATVSGLQIASYANLVKIASLTYTLKVLPVISGVESGPILTRAVTPSATSVQLTTPMKRKFPFPNTGMN